MNKNSGSLSVPIKKFIDQAFLNEVDCVAVEEPLEIRLTYSDEVGKELTQTITVTMRTPGDDIDLALGFLYTEGVIEELTDVIDASACGPVLNQAQSQNIVRVSLHKNIKVNLAPLDRNNFTNSSCGICGKTSIEALRTKLPQHLANQVRGREDPHCSWSVIVKLPDLLRRSQSLFEQTGGLHASALFTAQGELVALREDVGRHNALDKLIGHAFRHHLLPLVDKVLLVSGRVSFELVQKASMAGIPIIAAVGAPSSLALELAEERGMSLVGFVRNQRFNVYCGSQRIQ